MKVTRTERGFEIVEFLDHYRRLSSLQQSSIATERCVWLGVDTDRMHLNRAQVCELINHLCAWLVSDSFELPDSTIGSPMQRGADD